MKSRIRLVVIWLLVAINVAAAQTTAFTYQGKLTDGATPASGQYDFQFKLFDTATVGTGAQQGTTLSSSAITVSSGIFTVQLDFGLAALNGLPRFLEIGVRLAGSPDPYTILAPRQPLTSAPYGVRSLNASVADTLSSACVGCVTSTQVGSVSGAAVTGPIPVASVPSGSPSYVQNSTSQQASSNFNISGNGTAGGTLSANAVDSATQYNIGGSRAFTVSSFFRNVFAGVNAGAAGGSGGSNSFFGHGAGQVNASGAENSFFGRDAGNSNTASNNSLFGSEAGFGNSTGTRNSSFGRSAGRNNSVGSDNAFFGYQAGLNNTASFNSFFGSHAGDSTTSGTSNAFFGYNAGQANLTGANNSFFGYRAGVLSVASGNSFFGSSAGESTISNGDNSFFGYQSGFANTANNNAFFGSQAGVATSSGGSNTFLGTLAGSSNISGNHNTIIGAGADVQSSDLTFATAIGAGSLAHQSREIRLGRDTGADNVYIPGPLTAASGALVFGSLFTQFLQIDSLGTGGSTSLCLNSSKILSTCSSSMRYKTAVHSFLGGLDIVRRLRPIAFSWKEDGRRDVGFAAEEVMQIEPLLVTNNDNGEIEGVKYGQLTTVLVNAVKEQQAQLTEQQHTIQEQRQQNQYQEHQLRQQQQQLAALKRLVCLSHPRARVCK